MSTKKIFNCFKSLIQSTFSRKDVQCNQFNQMNTNLCFMDKGKQTEMCFSVKEKIAQCRQKTQQDTFCQILRVFRPELASKICVRIKVELLAHIMSKTACNFIYNKCYMTTKRRNVFRRFLEIDCSRVTALFVDTAEQTASLLVQSIIGRF